jgi:hypothetical protein
MQRHFLPLGDRNKSRTYSNCVSVGRPSKTTALDAVFGVVPTTRSGRLSLNTLALPGRQIYGHLALAPHLITIDIF